MSALDPLGASSQRPRLFAFLNSKFESGIKSPIDGAILARAVEQTEGFSKVDEVPFDFERRRLSVVVKNDQNYWFITKGAPESILAVCSTYEVDGSVRILTTGDQERCRELFQKVSGEGYRAIAVAYKVVPGPTAFGPADENELTLLGFLTFSDSPKKGVRDSLARLQGDGVKVKILTGDNEWVTRHICEQVGIDGGRAILGDEIEAMDEVALMRLCEETSVFARVSPAQKHRIIQALKSAGHVVGFLGDGINDAPSLHSADVGISVAGAVDVAKEASDIILLERRLDVLHDGVMAGRRSFANVIKYILMGTSSNFGNMLSMAGAAVFLPFLPMLPTQILLNNFLYDMAQMTIPTDHVDRVHLKKPHRWDMQLIRNFMLLAGPVSSIYDFLTFFLLLRVFSFDEPSFQTGWFVESLVTQTLVLLVIRTVGRPWKDPPSRGMVASIFLIVLAGLVLPYSRLGASFGFVPLPMEYFYFLVIVTVTYLIIIEFVKRRVLRALFS